MCPPTPLFSVHNFVYPALQSSTYQILNFKSQLLGAGRSVGVNTARGWKGWNVQSDRAD